MRGFMCQSTGASEVCMTGDPRHSVIVPRSPHNTRTHVNDSSRTRLITSSSTSAKHPRLGDSKTNRLTDDDHQMFKKRPLMCNFSVSHDVRGGAKPQHDRELKPEPSSLQVSSSDNVFQVVVMRVSLHCQGCAGKVKKHLSKMEGVTAFSIDLETKMVRVMGNVSRVGVLESVSKVKRAELWPSS